MNKTTFFWMRRDLRLNDNTGLRKALKDQKNVQIVFIFDTEIITHLPKNDARITFIWDQLKKINEQLKPYKSSVLVAQGKPLDVWKKLIDQHQIQAVYTNRDYEPKTILRDQSVRFLLETNGISYTDFKDHVFFEKDEVLKSDGSPYTVYTPYKNKWLEKLVRTNIEVPKSEAELYQNFTTSHHPLPNLAQIGFERSALTIPPYVLEGVDDYETHRDFPALDKTTHIGHHLRFGTVSIRSLIYYTKLKNQTYLSELIWRDFFSQILAHFPHVENAPFKQKYQHIAWRNNETEFEQWCKGETGYPIVDAGMRQLNQTGFMHNRVRMITASFLIKHLLIDWRWGEAYFAEKLLDFDLASNNGNWQWAAGTGCDAAPYFRVFNPALQTEKFDQHQTYIKQWIPDFDAENYLPPMVDHAMARDRAIKAYKLALQDYPND